MFGKKKKKQVVRAEPVTERDKQFERERQVREIHKMLIPKPKELLMSPRAIIKYGTVSMKVIGSKKPRKLRFLFLFNDVILITKREGKAQFRLRYYICLRSGHKVEEVNGKGQYAAEIRLVCPRKTFSFIAKDKAQKEAWTEALRGSIEGQYDLFTKQPPATPPEQKKKETEDEKKDDQKKEDVSKEVLIQNNQVFNFADFDMDDFMDEDDESFLKNVEDLTLGGLEHGEEEEEKEEESETESEEESEEAGNSQDEIEGTSNPSEEKAESLESQGKEEEEEEHIFLSASEESE